MIVLIDNQPVSIHCKGEDAEAEFAGTEEYREITNALNTLAKHCESFVFSAHSSSNGAMITYNHALGNEDMGGKMYKQTVKEKGKKAANEALRGTDLVTHLTNLIIEGQRVHGIDEDAVLATLQAGIIVARKLEGMSHKERREFNKKMDEAKNSDESLDTIYNTVDDLKSLRRNRSKSTYVKTSKNAHIDTDKVEEKLSEELGANVRAFKMSDPDVIVPLAEALSNNLESNVVIGVLPILGNGDMPDESSVVIKYQENLPKIARKNGVDYDHMKIALASTMAISVLRQLSEEYDLPDGFFEGYCRKERL